MENMTSASSSASHPTIEELENGLFIGKSNTGLHVGGFHEHETEENELLGNSTTGPPVGGFQEHEVQENESLEPHVLSCKIQAINDLSPPTPEPLPEGIPGEFYDKSFFSMCGLHHTCLYDLLTLFASDPGPPLSSTFMVRTPAKIERRQSTKKEKEIL